MGLIRRLGQLDVRFSRRFWTSRDRNGRYAVVRHPGAGLWFLYLF